MKKIIFSLALISSVAFAPTIYALNAKSAAIEVFDKGDKKKKKTEKCAKGKKSCCAGKESKETTQPAQ